MAVSKIAFALSLAMLSSHAAVIQKRSNTYSFDLDQANAGQAEWKSSSNFPFYFDNNDFMIIGNDGNFGIYDNVGNPLWNTNPQGVDCSNAGCQLQFQGDGNLVLVDYNANPPNAFWSTGTNVNDDHPVQAYTLVFQNYLPYIALYDQYGDSIWSSDGAHGAMISGGSPPGQPPEGGCNGAYPQYCV